MSSSTQVTDFSDLIRDLLNRVRDSTTSGGTPETIAKRYLNIALHDVHLQQNWPWAERNAVVLTRGTYTTGTVSIASTARTTLEGSGSLWNTAIAGMGFNNMRARGKLTISGETEVYIVSSVSSDTAGVLESRYVGSPTVASAYPVAYSDYTYYEDEYELASDFWRLVDARQFGDGVDIPIMSKQDFFRKYPRNTTTDKPRICTILELGPSGSTAQRPRVLFHPAPNAIYQIPYRYITTNLAVSSTGTFAANLSADTDEPIIPLRYRHVLVLHALYQWYRDRKDDQRTQLAQSDYVDLVKRMANDSDPQRDRPSFRTSRSRYSAPLRWVSNRSRRYSGDDRFDTLRD